jgi:hypothetical protein
VQRMHGDSGVETQGFDIAADGSLGGSCQFRQLASFSG